MLPTTRLLAALLISGFALLPLSGCQTTMNTPSATANQPLQNTYWKLLELTGQVPLVQPHTREAFLQLLPTDNRVEGSGGCNRMMGKFASSGAGLTVGSVAMTKMACMTPGLMDQEQRFANALQATTGYRISGDMLELLGSGAVLARFQMQVAPAKP
jgi:heat shock protein HslJ